MNNLDPQLHDVSDDEQRPPTKGDLNEFRTGLITEIEGTEKRIDEKFDRMETRLRNVEGRMDNMETTLNKISNQLDNIEDDMKGLPQDVVKLKTAVFGDKPGVPH